jgi:DNA modification methylase
MPSRWQVYMPLDEILPAARNPRNHDLEWLGKSVDRLGIVDVVTLDERTGRLVSGHGRLDTIAKTREEIAGGADKDIPDGVEVLDDGTWTVPVDRGWSSKDDADTALVAMNGGKAGWEETGLGQLLADIEAADDSLLEIADYDHAQVAALLGELETSGSTVGWGGRLEPDQVPPAPPEHVTAKGDLWVLGNHRLICGDCTTPTTVEALFDGRKPDAILTDPPYCSGGFQEAGRAEGSIGTDAKIKPRIANDTLSTRGYRALIKTMLELSGAHILYIFTDWRMWVNLFDLTESSGFGVRNMIVWGKPSPGMGRGWRTQHELVMFATDAVVEFDNHKAQGNLILCDRTGNHDHPTQKPVEVLERILAVTDMAEVIYDPFAGSGSTLVAAENQRRACRLLELDPGYCDIICSRFQAMTGQLPMRNGEPHDFGPFEPNPEEVET